MSGFVTVLLSMAAAVFYLGAAVILKQWAHLPLWLAACGALVTLGLACVIEIEVLRRARFADVVVLIIAAEVAMAVLLSHMVFGEGLRARDVLGLIVVVFGLVLLIGGEVTGREDAHAALGRRWLA